MPVCLSIYGSEYVGVYVHVSIHVKKRVYVCMLGDHQVILPDILAISRVAFSWIVGTLCDMSHFSLLKIHLLQLRQSKYLTTSNSGLGLGKHLCLLHGVLQHTGDIYMRKQPLFPQFVSLPGAGPARNCRKNLSLITLRQMQRPPMHRLHVLLHVLRSTQLEPTRVSFSFLFPTDPQLSVSMWNKVSCHLSVACFYHLPPP